MNSVYSLILVNSIPLFGAIFFGWSLFSIMFLYWAENLVVGFWNAIRMGKAEGAVPVPSRGFRLNGKPYETGMKAGLIVFFLFHYGIFTAVHGVFVASLFGPARFNPDMFLFGIIPLFVSHGVSYAVNFVGKEEYRRVSAPELFIQPYKRVVILHLTLLLGGFFVMLLGAPVLALVLLVVLKTFADVLSHTIEHKSFASHPPLDVLLHE